VESKPLLIVISGPTAVGKDAVIKLMFDKRIPLHFVVTATDRKPRTNEVDGKDYIFVTTERFQEMIQNNELAEYARVYDNYKGIPRTQIEPALESGKDVILRVDVQGAQQLRKMYPDCVQIFLTTTNQSELRQRIEARKSEKPDEIERRLLKAREELTHIPKFDYLVVNSQDRLDETVNTILAIITAEHQRIARRIG
jgi:guanylate kinase